MSDAPADIPAPVRALLDEVGLLPISDVRLPSVVSLVAGEPVAGSWWGHPSGHAIYHVCEALIDDPDLVLVKLVERKQTYVHRRLWPALLGVAEGREPWQLRALPPDTLALLSEVEREGELLLERRGGRPVRQLEERLLVHGGSVHTPSGAHAKVLQTWPRWAERAGFREPRLTPEAGRAALDAAARRLARCRASAG